MKAFDPNYKLLDEMYQDNYYPAFLVDKVKDELQKVIDLLESGETDAEVVQEMLDEAVCGINDLQEEFDENDSEIETVARECIAANVAYLDLEHDIYGNPDGTGGYDFKDGFEIRIEYQTHDELLSHADMITCLAFEQDGSYYLIDDRPDNGRTIRQIDEAFYHELEALFEEAS